MRVNLLCLPDHAHRLILLELNARDALSLSNTCATMRACTDGPGFWKLYMKSRTDLERSGRYAQPDMFAYEVLPRRLEWTDRELLHLQAARVCVGRSRYCQVDYNYHDRGQWVCKDGIRRSLCGQCHETQHGEMIRFHPWKDDSAFPADWQDRRRSVLHKAFAQERISLPLDDEWCSSFLNDRHHTFSTTETLAIK